MGCGTSKADIARYQALEQEKSELELQLTGLEQQMQALSGENGKMKTQHKEQCNLLRFKIEVLVHMLAMEEKKLEASVKRLDALKWATLTQGITEQTMADSLNRTNARPQRSGDKDVLLTSEFDINGAFTRMEKEFKESRERILSGFADEEGRICTALGREEFLRKLYSMTEDLSRTDVQVLSLTVNNTHLTHAAVCNSAFPYTASYVGTFTPILRWISSFGC